MLYRFMFVAMLIRLGYLYAMSIRKSSCTSTANDANVTPFTFH